MTKPIQIHSYLATCEHALERAIEADRDCIVESATYAGCTSDDLIQWFTADERIRRSTRRYDKALAQYPTPGRNYRPGK